MDVIYLDLSRDSDTVSGNIRLAKTEKYGVAGGL